MTLTKAQRWILERLEAGASVKPAGCYEVHHSFTGAPPWYGAPQAAFAACIRRGLIANDVITPAGRLALKEHPTHD